MAHFRTTEINQIINLEVLVKRRKMNLKSGEAVNDSSERKWKELNVQWKQVIHSEESVLNDSEPVSS